MKSLLSAVTKMWSFAGRKVGVDASIKLDDQKNRADFVNEVISVVLSKDHKSIFWGDRLLTLDKSAGFLDNSKFRAAFDKIRGSHVYDQYGGPGTIAWRLHTLVWAAEQASHIAGDFMECGVFKGDMSWTIATVLSERIRDKKFHLFDSFEGFSSELSRPEDFPDNPGFIDFANSIYGQDGLYDAVCARFQSMPNIRIVKGFLPDALSTGIPESIAFLHMDLNSPEAEVKCLNLLFDRVSPGGLIVFDDYGWKAFRAQKVAEDNFFADRGYSVLELPTGQGLVVKR